MRRLFLALSATGCLLSAPTHADPTQAELAAVREAETRGAEIYAYDQAAWHSTDRFQSDLSKRDWTLEKAQQKGLMGYIVEPDGDGLLLASYYGARDGRLFALARYWVRDGKVERGGFLSDADDSSLSLLALQLVQTRKQAMASAVEQKYFRCTSGNVNVVVLPPRADGSIPVYVMSSPVEQGVFPAGGHSRYVFDGNGKLLSSRPFSNGCVNIGSSNASKQAAGIVLSHLLDPQPTEMHVFISRNVQLPLFVITVGNHDLWEVSKGKVTWRRMVNEVPK